MPVEREIPTLRREWRFLRQPRHHNGFTLRMPASSRNIVPIWVTFDHDQAVADAGLMLTGTLAKPLTPLRPGPSSRVAAPAVLMRRAV